MLTVLLSVYQDWGRPKRVVKYRKGYDMWTYVAGDKRLPGKAILTPFIRQFVLFIQPVQWSTWLTHTRSQAPTLEVRGGIWS